MNQITYSDFLARIRKLDSSVLDVLSLEISRETKPEIGQLIWIGLTTIEGGDNPGFCIELVRFMKTVLSNDFERFLLDRWDGLSELARGNICYAFACENTMSSSFAEVLFLQKVNTTSVRHRIFAGLVSSIEERQPFINLNWFIDKIGTHENERKQEILDRFLTRVKNAFL